jgi:hypothetical protein
MDSAFKSIGNKLKTRDLGLNKISQHASNVLILILVDYIFLPKAIWLEIKFPEQKI